MSYVVKLNSKSCKYNNRLHLITYWKPLFSQSEIWRRKESRRGINDSYILWFT